MTALEFLRKMRNNEFPDDPEDIRKAEETARFDEAAQKLDERSSAPACTPRSRRG